ncbi:hypothetical protein GCM10009696_32430 [Kocuria himachalensis]
MLGSACPSADRGGTVAGRIPASPSRQHRIRESFKLPHGERLRIMGVTRGVTRRVTARPGCGSMVPTDTPYARDGPGGAIRTTGRFPDVHPFRVASGQRNGQRVF